jgi:8-oxo-dGTP pyrophosphatase MutT (NUDIX family)
VFSSLSLERIAARVRAYRPRLEPQPLDPRHQAAVSVILHAGERGEPELLFIERASRDGDPWSGQMAFPGGRRELEDPSLEATAARETLEEVGLELPPPLGRLDDFTNAGQVARLPGLQLVCVAPYVYHLAQRARLRCSDEVASAVWVPLAWIAQPQSAATHQLEYTAFRGTFPAFVYERYKVWGMTYRILECLAAAIDIDLPARRLFGLGADDSGAAISR